MGDTGSLSVGGIIAVIAILVRKELMLPILCGVFLVETLSVIMQVSFLNIQRENMELEKGFFNESHSPPFSKKGLSETKIVSRFWIVSILLAILTLITLKLR